MSPRTHFFFWFRCRKLRIPTKMTLCCSMIQTMGIRPPFATKAATQAIRSNLIDRRSRAPVFFFCCCRDEGFAAHYKKCTVVVLNISHNLGKNLVDSLLSFTHLVRHSSKLVTASLRLRSTRVVQINQSTPSTFSKGRRPLSLESPALSLRAAASSCPHTSRIIRSCVPTVLISLPA